MMQDDAAEQVGSERLRVGCGSGEYLAELGDPDIKKIGIKAGGREFPGGDPLFVVGGPFERDADVRAIVTKPEPDIERPHRSAAGGHCERVEMGEVANTHHCGFAGADQSVFGVCLDGFEEPEPRRPTLVRPHNKRLRLERFDVDSRRASVECRDRSDGVEIEPVNEHTQRRKTRCSSGSRRS